MFTYLGFFQFILNLMWGTLERNFEIWTAAFLLPHSQVGKKGKGKTYSETFGNECYLTINWRNIPHEYRLSNAQTSDSFIIEVDNVNSPVLTSQELYQILHNYYRCTPKVKTKNVWKHSGLINFIFWSVILIYLFLFWYTIQCCKRFKKSHFWLFLHDAYGVRLLC